MSNAEISKFSRILEEVLALDIAFSPSTSLCSCAATSLAPLAADSADAL